MELETNKVKRVFNETYGFYEIIGVGKEKSTVRFDNTGSVYEFHNSVVAKNRVKDYMARTVMGIGYLGRQTTNTGDKLPRRALSIWNSVLQRCYKNNSTERPNYDGCTVADEWHCFANFCTWFREQVELGYYVDGYQLDKDLLIRGNKVYSKETCVFLPFRLNSLLQVKKRSKYNYLPGVNFDKARGLFKSEVNFNGVRYYGPRRESEIEAFLDYKELKEKLVRVDAIDWQGMLPNSAIKALSEYSLDWILEDLC